MDTNQLLSLKINQRLRLRHNHRHRITRGIVVDRQVISKWRIQMETVLVDGITRIHNMDRPDLGV